MQRECLGGCDDRSGCSGIIASKEEANELTLGVTAQRDNFDSLAAANSLQRTTTLELEGLCAVLPVVEVKGTIRKIRITLAGEGSLLACLVVSGAGLIPHQQHGLHTLDGGEHCGSVGHVERVARHTPPLAGGSRLRSHSHVVLGRGIVGVVGQRHGAPSGHTNHLVLLRCGIKHTDAEVLSF